MAGTWACASCGGENQPEMRFCGHCGTPAGASGSGPETEVTDALRSFISHQVADRLVESGGDLAEERRLVTALFADLSGFTPLADRLDPEELLEVIDPVIKRLTNIVGRYEGYVDKFAGDALLAFFGAPIAHEDDAQRALMVALEMHQEVAAMIPELPEDAGELTLHIGVNSGRVVARVLGTDVRMDYSVLGDAVILAQRLESAAGPGETYVGTTTHMMTADDFTFESIGELTLKGKAEPVSAWKLIGKKRTWVPTRDNAFVGRAEELKTMDALLDGLTSGQGAVVSVTGEPGVGKSRFTKEVRRRARDRGARWLTTRCLSYGAGIAYWPLAEMFRSLAGIIPTDPPEKSLERLETSLGEVRFTEGLPYFARLLGLPSPEADRLEPEAYRRELHEMVARALVHLASERPIVLAVEDLHWADASSIALTSELAKLSESIPLMLYITARSEAFGVLLEIASRADENLRHALQLDPMDEDVIAPLIEGLLGGPAPAEVVAMVNELAVGNPFFTRELLRSLQDSGDLKRAAGVWVLAEDFTTASVPPTIEGVLAARLDMLPRPVASTLQVAAVIGRRVKLPLLRAVDSAPDLAANLDTLVAAELLDPTPDEEELHFHHALVQDVAYSRLLRRTRKSLHRKVAKEAERLYGSSDDSIDLLARHLHLAEAGDKAIEYLVRAGARAKHLFANDEALIHFGHALDLARKSKRADELVPDVLLNIADLHELRGNYEDAFALFTEARDIGGSVFAWRGMAAALRNQSEYDAALKLIDEAFEAALAAEELPLLWLERGWILARQGRFPDAIDALQRGLGASTQTPKGVIGELLVQLTRAETVVGHIQDALAHAEQAMDIFEELDDPKGLVSAYRVSTDPYLSLERLDDASDKLRRGIELAEKIGAAQELGACLINLGLVELKRGSLDDAIACDERAVANYDRIGFATGQAFGNGNLAEKLLLAGRHMEALDTAAKALDLARSIGDLETVADVTKTVAAVRHVQGHISEAAATAEESAELYLQIGAIPTAVEALEMVAEFHTEAGDEKRARASSARALSISTTAQN